MSNLSELLPTGGGQNAVEFTAAENISSGQAVALKTDGQIEAADSANLANVIGLAAAAITSGATGDINVFGGINEAQTGLTIGSNYYINSSGSLTTSNTRPYLALGQAISATTINLRDLSDNYGPAPVAFDYLAIAGGGGGAGNRGGGGGAGGYLSGTASYLPTATFTVTIGAGGSGTGSTSVFGSITSSGGGGGGTFDTAGGNGGSGGGAGGGNSVRSGGTATSGQGNNGGSNLSTGSPWVSGGGGGAGGAGQNSSGSTSGSGGAGLAWSVDSTTRAGGGGGGRNPSSGAGSGGSGGGGAGSSTAFAAGTAGTANTGGGGGGGGDSGGSANGGSGVVILRTSNTAADLTIPGTLTYTKTTPTGYKLYTFTAGTGTVTV